MISCGLDTTPAIAKRLSATSSTRFHISGRSRPWIAPRPPADVGVPCRQVVALVDSKAKPQVAQEFKQWLVAVAQKVAEAAKEGGFLGFGGTQVSEQEAATIKELSTALAVKI